MSAPRFWAVALALTLTACSSSPAPTVTPTTQTVAANAININTAVLSQLDGLEAKLALPGLSNRIQASRPYATPEELVTKQVLTQAQFEQVKDQVTVMEVALTGEARDVDYLLKLSLMAGHLRVAKELIDQRQASQALPHLGHPVEEIYVDLEDQLTERQVPEFKTALITLQDLVKATPTSPEIAVQFPGILAALDQASQVLPATQRQDPKFVLKVIDGLLDAAGSEYLGAIAKGKITAIIEYQDSRGFIAVAEQLHQSITPQLTKINPKAEKELTQTLGQLRKAWPTVLAPAAPVLTPAQVQAAITQFKTASQTLL